MKGKNKLVKGNKFAEINSQNKTNNDDYVIIKDGKVTSSNTVDADAVNIDKMKKADLVELFEELGLNPSNLEKDNRENYIKLIKEYYENL